MSWCFNIASFGSGWKKLSEARHRLLRRRETIGQRQHFGGEPSTSMQEFIAKAYGTESKDDIVVFVVPYITKQISSQEYFPFNQPLGIAWIDTFVDGSFPTPNPKYYGCAFVSARPWVEYDFSRLSSDREVETTLFAHEIGHLLTNYGHQSHKTNLMLNGDASSSDELRYNGANRLSRSQETLIRAHRSLQGNRLDRREW